MLSIFAILGLCLCLFYAYFLVLILGTPFERKYPRENSRRPREINGKIQKSSRGSSRAEIFSEYYGLYAKTSAKISDLTNILGYQLCLHYANFLAKIYPNMLINFMLIKKRVYIFRI